MKIKYYTVQYLSKNYNFPERPEQPIIEFVSQEYDGHTYTMNKAGFEFFKSMMYDTLR